MNGSEALIKTLRCPKPDVKKDFIKITDLAFGGSERQRRLAVEACEQIGHLSYGERSGRLGNIWKYNLETCKTHHSSHSSKQAPRRSARRFFSPILPACRKQCRSTLGLVDCGPWLFQNPPKKNRTPPRPHTPISSWPAPIFSP